MPIYPDSENLVSLNEAAHIVPKRRGGRPTNLSTLYRWSVAGCRGVTLETIQIGGTRFTSREALTRFFHRLTEKAGVSPDLVTNLRRSPASRDRAVKAAMRELKQRGA